MRRPTGGLYCRAAHLRADRSRPDEASRCRYSRVRRRRRAAAASRPAASRSCGRWPSRASTSAPARGNTRAGWARSTARIATRPGASSRRRSSRRSACAEYAETFPAVCGDFAFYQFPSDEYWAGLFGSTPDGVPLRPQGAGGHHGRDLAGSCQVRQAGRASRTSTSWTPGSSSGSSPGRSSPTGSGSAR